MNFEEFKIIFENEFQITKMADIARELEVTPQVVYSWKTRNQVPYTYVKKLKEKIGQQDYEVNEKLLINSSKFETFMKLLEKHSSLISHMISRLKFGLILTIIFCIVVFYWALMFLNISMFLVLNTFHPLMPYRNSINHQSC